MVIVVYFHAKTGIGGAVVVLIKASAGWNQAPALLENLEYRLSNSFFVVNALDTPHVKQHRSQVICCIFSIPFPVDIYTLGAS
jgi:hypothetical protein